jgi:hypothetical protein
MDTEAQHVAIGTAAGLPDIKTSYGFTFDAPHYLVASSSMGDVRALVPFYTKDLNAINEAVAALEEPQRTIFMNILSEIVGWRGDEFSLEGYTAHTPALFCFCNATAAQRSEAFLRTLGKWQVSPASATAPLP